MKLRLRRHETRETLKVELANTCTLHDLQRHLNPTAPSSIHLSLNRKDELLASSPVDTLRSLGVASGDLIYYSLDQSAFHASVQVGESSDWKMGDYETLGSKSEKNKEIVGFAEVDVVPRFDLNTCIEDVAEGSMGESSGMQGPEPMDVEVTPVKSKRLSVPFFLKHILLEKSGDTSELTSLALSVHAVMLESGFLLLDHGSGKLSFSKELLSVSLRYTLPELVNCKDNNTVESVTLRFQNIGPRVAVYGTLGGPGQRVHMTYLDKRRLLRVIDLVIDTLKFEKEGNSIHYREVFMFWRMVKDVLAIPLMIGLCEKTGLESPPCLMHLPTELKLKILESLPGESVGNMACVCTEMRYLASDGDLWKQKCVQEPKICSEASSLAGDSVDWKSKFVAFWEQKKRIRALKKDNAKLRHIRDRILLPQIESQFSQRIGDPRFPRIIRDPTDPFAWLNGNNPFHGTGIQQGQFGFGGRQAWAQRFTPRCNLDRR